MDLDTFTDGWSMLDHPYWISWRLQTRHQFSSASSGTYKLCARARQFSSFILMSTIFVHHFLCSCSVSLSSGSHHWPQQVWSLSRHYCIGMRFSESKQLSFTLLEQGRIRRTFAFWDHSFRSRVFQLYWLFITWATTVQWVLILNESRLICQICQGIQENAVVYDALWNCVDSNQATAGAPPEAKPRCASLVIVHRQVLWLRTDVLHLTGQILLLRRSSSLKICKTCLSTTTCHLTLWATTEARTPRKQCVLIPLTLPFIFFLTAQGQTQQSETSCISYASDDREGKEQGGRYTVYHRHHTSPHTRSSPPPYKELYIAL